VEMKMGQATSDQTSVAQQAHYSAENQIMTHVKGMSLAGKQLLAQRMHDHVKQAEMDAKARNG